MVSSVYILIDKWDHNLGIFAVYSQPLWQAMMRWCTLTPNLRRVMELLAAISLPSRSRQREYQHIINGNSRTVPYKAIFSGDIPLHRPKK